MKPHLHLLTKLGACREAQAFAGTCPDLETAWNTCDRSDWMIWLLRRLKYDDAKVYRLYSCWCVRNTPLANGRMVWDLLTDPRSRNAVVVAERFAVGEATADELREARNAADAAAAATYADATTYAADAAATTYAADAAATAADADATAATYADAATTTAAYADAAATYAYAYAYAYAKATYAWTAARKAQARQLREMVPFNIIAGLIK